MSEFTSCPQCHEQNDWKDMTGGLTYQAVVCAFCKCEFEVHHSCGDDGEPCTSWVEPLTNETRVALKKQEEQWERNQSK